MQGLKNVVSFFIPGTLGANVAIPIIFPFAWTLEMVTAFGSNANDGKLEIGTASDADGYLTSAAIGDSNSPVEFDHADWNGAVYAALANKVSGITRLRIAADAAVILALDYDGAGGTASANVMINVIYTEG